MSLNTKGITKEIEIKLEIEEENELDFNVEVKLEPEEEEEDYTVAEDVPPVRNITVKKEPDFCQNATNNESKHRICDSPQSILPDTHDTQDTQNFVKFESAEERSSLLRRQEANEGNSDDREESEDDNKPLSGRKKKKENYCVDGEDSSDDYKPPRGRKKTNENYCGNEQESEDDYKPPRVRKKTNENYCGNEQESEDDKPLRGRKKTKEDYCEDEDESEEDYKPPPVRKKRKYTVNRTSNVKPTYCLKKATKYKFSSEVLSKIEIVTITEQERQVEFDLVAASRSHFKYICALCGQGYATQEAYVVHMKVHSPEQGQYKCDICHYRHRNELALHHHRLRHYRRYRCVTCHAMGSTWQFRDRETAACHVMTEHEKALWDCHLCGKGFKRPQYLKIHINQLHTKTDNLQCPLCEKVFHEKAVYRCHLRKHNEEVNPTYTGPLRCETCKKDFKTYYSYNRHNKAHGKRKTCHICGELCKNRDAVDRHLRRKHGFTLEQSNGHPCPNCPRILVTQTMLQRHMRRMHTERTKDFQCDHCKRFYYSKAEVRTHIMWSHLSVAGHACECGRVFRTPARYRSHVAKEHEGREPPKDHVCDVCQKGFPSKQQLTRHTKVHTDQTYPCSECEATFRTRDYVKVHYQLKHLNMTRAQINALKKPKKPKTLDDGFKVQNMKEIPKKVEEQPLYCEVRIKEETEEICHVGIKEEVDEQEGIHAPLFETFVDVVRK